MKRKELDHRVMDNELSHEILMANFYEIVTNNLFVEFTIDLYLFPNVFSCHSFIHRQFNSWLNDTTRIIIDCFVSLRKLLKIAFFFSA